PGGRTIRLWDVASRRPFGRLTGHTDDVLNIKFANDERLLSEGADDTVRIWDVPSHQQIGRPIHAPGTNVAFGPSPSLLVAGGTLWDLASRSKTPLSLTGNV